MSQILRAAPARPEADAVTAQHHQPPYLVALGASAALFLLYALTLAPTTAFWDTSEYIATGHILGIPHPPGNPLFVILARTWDLLLSPFGLPVAQRINLFSAFMTAGASFFWFLVVHRILTFFTTSELVRRVGAGVAILVSGTAFTVWNQSNVNEKVYTVTLFTIALLSWIAFLWRDHVEEHAGQRNRRWHDDNAILLALYILALSVGNHLMAFLAAPALLLFLVLVKARSLLNWRLYPLAIGAAALAFTVQLYLPIRSNLGPVINEASPRCESIATATVAVLTLGSSDGDCGDLGAALRREQYQKPSFVSERMAPFHWQLANFFQYFDWQWSRSIQGRDGYMAGGRILFTLLFLGLGLFGAVEHFGRDRKSFWYVALLFFTLSVGLVYYMNFKYGYIQTQQLGLGESEVRERDYFYTITFSVWGLWVGVGLTALWLRLSEVLGERRNRLLLASPVLALGLLPLGLNWKYASRSGDYAARDFAYNLLQSVDPYGVLITNGDNDTFPLWYLQEVEGIRRDVTVVVMSYFNTPWYPKQLRDLTAPCQQPNQSLSDVTRVICQRPYEPARGLAMYGNPQAPRQSMLPLSDAQIDAITAQPGFLAMDSMTFVARGSTFQLYPGAQIFPAHVFITHMLQTIWGDRPIHFASTTNTHLELGLGEMVARQGLSFRLLTPQETQRAGLERMPADPNVMQFTGGFMDRARHRALLEREFSFRNMPDRAVWPDDATRNIPMQYVYAWWALATAEEVAGNSAQSERDLARGTAFRELAEGR